MPVEEDEEEAEAAETEPNGNNQHNGDVLGELAFIFTFRSNHILCRKLSSNIGAGRSVFLLIFFNCLSIYINIS